jgi:two-component system sensor histidine kinase AlgZ
LAWLIAVCALKGRLNRLALSRQWLCGIVLGVLSGLYGCGLLALLGLLQPVALVGQRGSGRACCRP